MDAVAVDFETANEKKSSACSIGLAWINHASIVRTESFLIKPPEERFSAFNKKIHGITKSDTVNAENFHVIWDGIFGKNNIPLLVCHNADFDIKVILECFSHYSVHWKELSYICTLEISQRLWPDQISYKLDAISVLMGLNLQHHDAESDAVAAAKIVIEAINKTGSSDLFEALQRLKIVPKMIKNVESNLSGNAIDLESKSFGFTGGLIYVTRQKAVELVRQHNGVVHTKLNKKTDFFVIGSKPANSKLLLANSIKNMGYDLHIITENEFLEIIEFRR